MVKKCLNCGDTVSKRFARVYGDNSDEVHACPGCSTYREMKVGKTADVV